MELLPRSSSPTPSTSSSSSRPASWFSLRRKLGLAVVVSHALWLGSMHNQALVGGPVAAIANTNADDDAIRPVASLLANDQDKASVDRHQESASALIRPVATNQNDYRLRRHLSTDDTLATTTAAAAATVDDASTLTLRRDTRRTMAESSPIETTSSRSNSDSGSNHNNVTANESLEDSPFAQTIAQGAPKCSGLRSFDISYTLVTQCDDERVPMIAQHCLQWQGLLSVAVFSERSAIDIVAQLVDLGCGADQVHVETLSAASFSVDAYPVNHLRNMAIQNVNTTHIVYMDIDFLPSSNLEATLRMRSIRMALSKDYKHALVIPAFEYLPAAAACPNCTNSNLTQEELLQNMPRTKQDLRRLHQQGEASMFHEYWPVAHDSTDYDEWKWQERGTLRDIPCIKANNYEPYLVFRKCQELAPFQESFTGYGYNKASFTMQLQAMRYKFSQIGGVFCTHFPHAASKARQVFDKTKTPAAGKRREIKELVANFTKWLNDTYGQHMEPLMPYCDKIVTANPNATVTKPEWQTIDFVQNSSKLGVCNHVKPEEVTYSIVTQCSDDRLWMMEHHCKRWAVNNSQPFISLLVYTNDTLTRVKENLLNLSCHVDNGMTVQVVPRVYNDKDYPVNRFRNQALAAVKTTHAIVLDVDFWVSTNLFSAMNTLAVRTKLSESVQHAMVVPAFQLHPHCNVNSTNCTGYHISLMPSVLDERMLSNLEAGNMTVFNIRENFDGHGSTRYDKWVDQAADDVMEIDCVDSNRYEPYLVVRVCQDLPPFQPVFTGYGKNKISWILQLRHLGWKLFQLGQGFVTHFPHPESHAKQNWKKVPDRSQRYSLDGALFPESLRVLNENRLTAFKRWMAETIPDQTQVRKCNGTESGFGQDDDAWW